MAVKNYSVHFAQPSTGQGRPPFCDLLQLAFDAHGQHLPAIVIEGERFQVRSLELVGTVWKAAFARLRNDAPNYVNVANEEQELQLEEGASVIEKCFFLYRSQSNVLVWQYQKTAGGLGKAQVYLSTVFGQVISLPQLMNNEELEKILAHNVYELDFAYARPPALPADISQWSRRAFDIMGDVHAAFAKFTLRAERGGSLGNAAKAVVRTMIGGGEFKKVKVRLTSDTDAVKLFLAPIRDEFTIEVPGRYAPSALVFQGLEQAYDRQQHLIPIAAAQAA